jgi:hypothetical protein
MPLFVGELTNLAQEKVTHWVALKFFQIFRCQIVARSGQEIDREKNEL